jgi:hypothetical protein
MSDNLKNRLAKIEDKIQTSTGDEAEQKKQADLMLLLEMNEYEYKKMKMTMSNEDILQAEKEASAYVLERYSGWLKMSEAERKLEQERTDKELTVEIDEFRAWRLSDEGKQFDVEYAKRFGPHEAVLNEC